ncbi:MAG: YciI family protein [Kofleriaceae bacterium]|nr:YciI family protein [Kofleriaceae bacterium]
MRWFMKYTPTNPNQSAEHHAAIGAYAAEAARAGILVDTGTIEASGTWVKQVAGKHAHTDGPFPETKELIVGYAIINAATRDEAIAHARTFLSVAGDGEVEIRAMVGGAEWPPH